MIISPSLINQRGYKEKGTHRDYRSLETDGLLWPQVPALGELAGFSAEQTFFSFFHLKSLVYKATSPPASNIMRGEASVSMVWVDLSGATAPGAK